ncbi:MAG: hypothetical protein WCX82_03530 [archaeon]|jgi:hypothetical protein
MNWIIVITKNDRKPMQKFLTIQKNNDIKKICENTSIQYRDHDIILVLEHYSKLNTFSRFRMIWKNGELQKEFNFPEDLYIINTEQNKVAWKELLMNFELKNKN